MSAVTQDCWQLCLDVLRKAGSVALACHVGPDGDALGSMVALGLGLQRLGVPVVASWGGEPFEVPAMYSYLPVGGLLVAPADFPAQPEVLVTLDTGSADRLGILSDRVRTAGCTIVVDHHASNTSYGHLHLVDPTAAATAVLVAELLEQLEVPLDADIAAALYTGLVTDTGSFKYAATTPSVHLLAARLLATGIRHDLISRAIYDTAPFDYVRVLGRACAQARLEPAAVDGLGLVWTVIEPADLVGTDVGLAELEGVIDVLRTAQEAEIAVVLKADPVEGGWKVSVRSKGQVDVGEVCVELGGGGHRFAAGFTSADSEPAVLALLREVLDRAPHLE